jgi:hypothetical protein
VVDQIQEWLKLIPPEERQRWSWLLDQNTTAFGNPRMVDTPVGRVWNPTSYPSDLLSGLNTAVREPVQENVLMPALGVATYAASHLPSTPRIDWHIGPDGVGVQAVAPPPGGRRRFFSDEAEVPLEGTDFGRYWRENRPTEGIPGFLAGQVDDPASYIGGVVGETARGLAALPVLRNVPGVARGLGAVAGADELYSETMGKAVGSALGGAGWVGSRIPGVRQLLESSPGKSIAQFGANLGRAVRDPLAVDRLEHAVTGSKLGLTGRAADWEGKIEPGWQAIDSAMSEVEHPVLQAVLLRQRAKGLEAENLLEARFEQHRMALAELRDAGDLSTREFGRETQDLWQQQARATRAIQFGLIDTINAVKGRADELVGALPGTVDAAGNPVAATLGDVFGHVPDADVLLGTGRTALQRAGDEARAAHDFGTAIKGGTSGVDKVTGVFAGEGQHIAALQAQDPRYRQARETAMQELNQAAQTIYDRFKDVTDPDEMAGLIDTARSAYQAAENELAPFTQGISETLQGLAPEKLSAIIDVWGTGSAVSLDKQVRKVLTARRGIREQAAPLLQAWYREQGFDLATRTDAVEKALSSADRLLKEPALLDPSAAAARQEIVKRLNRFGGAGDVLKEGDLGKVSANLTTNAYAASLGVTNPPPWMGAAITTLGAWKELALLSPRYQLTNFITQLTLSEAANVPASRVISLLRRTLPEMKGAILRGERINPVFDEATSTSYGAIRGTAEGYFSIPDEVIGRQGEALIDGATGPATTRLGRIPLAVRAGVPALATGGAYWSQNADDPDRARNALLVGGAAGAFGAATPRFAFYNQQLTQATETAARGAAYLHGFEEEIGSMSGGRIKQMHDEIRGVLKPTVQASVGKELTRSDMLPGLNTVSDMRGLSDFVPPPKGSGVTALDPSLLTLDRAGPSPIATAGREVDIDAIEGAFAAVNGKLSPDALEQIALQHGATAEQAARLRSRWDQHAYAAENVGIRRSNDIHFDYSDVNRLTAGLRESSVAPFLTWQTKALPKYATMLLQNPKFLVAIDGLNNLSEEDVEAGGLTSRFARLVGMGVLGDVLAEQVLGQAGTVRGNPLSALFPYADVGREGTLPDDANPVQRGLAALQPLGLGPGPLVTLPLMAAGATSELPIDLFRTSGYLRALSTQLTGREADPELMTKRLMGAARQATGAGAEPTVTGDFLRDRAIRQRIAEIAVQETGKPPAGPYLLAMDDPASQIWLRARAQVDRQRMGEQAGTQAWIPFRTKFLSDTEAEIRRIREQTGVGPTESAERRAMPATAAELAQAELETRKKPLKPGETLEERVGTSRWIAAENAAAGINPLAQSLNSLGGDQALSRQFPEYLALQRRIKHMPPKRRGQMLAEFLGPRPAIKKYLSENNIYG